ncbi:MAG: hemerythrin domain-containing protein [Bacteroidales bacterium]|nr:hemerythrin domain-containing protein [Bacteroidales bacterium]
MTFIEKYWRDMLISPDQRRFLMFPYLEQKEITGPPKVMWGKHDEIREQLKGRIALLKEPELSKNDLVESLDLIFYPVIEKKLPEHRCLQIMWPFHDDIRKNIIYFLEQ